MIDVIREIMLADDWNIYGNGVIRHGAAGDYHGLITLDEQARQNGIRTLTCSEGSWDDARIVLTKEAQTLLGENVSVKWVEHAG